MEEESLKNLVVSYYGERFGVPSRVMERFSFIRRGDMVWATTARIKLAENLNIISAGVRMLRLSRDNQIKKPTTAGLQLLGSHLRKNIINVSTAQLTELLLRGRITLDEKVLECAEDGFVAVKWKQWIVGCARLKGNRLFNQIPSGRVRDLLEALITQANTQ